MTYNAGDGFLPSWGSGMKPHDRQDDDAHTAFSGPPKKSTTKTPLNDDQYETLKYGTLKSDLRKAERQNQKAGSGLSGPVKKSLWLFCVPSLLSVIVLLAFCFAFWIRPSGCWVLFSSSILVGVIMCIVGFRGGCPGVGGFSAMFFKTTGGCTIFLCLLGLLLGFIGFIAYYKNYEIYSLSRHYVQVSPSASPGGYRDAGVIDFTSDARVDAYKGVGYRNGVTFCAAPILGARSVGAGVARPSANFWAAGVDCCHHRGSFSCGESTNANVHSGLVVMDTTPQFSADIPMYLKAAQQSAAQNDLTLPSRPIFVYWTNNIQKDIDSYQRDGIMFAVMASIGLIFLMASIVLCCNGLNVGSGSVSTTPDIFDKYLMGPGSIVDKFFSESDGAAAANFARRAQQENLLMHEADGEDTTFTGHGGTLG